MSFPINPYITGNHVGDTHAFVGRDDIVRRVRQVLKQPNNNTIVLYGQRRIGKSSVLYELEAKLPQENTYHVVLFDLLDKSHWPLEKVLQELAKQINGVLPQEKLDLGDHPETTFRKLLTDLLKKLPLEQSFVLLFDEFDVLDDPENKNKPSASAVFFPYVRQLLDIDRQRLNFVFVIGRKIDDMTKIAKSLFKTAPTKRVSLLNQEDTFKLIRLSESNETLNWTNESIEAIWRLTSGHPYLTQHFCSHVWESLYDKNPDEIPIVTLKDVKAVEEQGDILEASRNALEWLWDGLPLAAQVIASALAEAGAGGISKAELDGLLSKSGIQIVIRELNEAPRLLADWDIIEEIEGSYRFRVELIRRWIAENKSFDEALDLALNQAYPDAENLYQKVLELYDAQFFEEAFLLLRRVVLKHPHHIKANKLLADMLLEQKEYNEARDRLEKLYRFQPDAVRSQLIQALLALAQSNNSEYEQVELYKRILVIEPKHPEAKRKKQEILKRQQEKKQQRINTIKGIYDKYSKRMWQFVGVIFAFVLSFYLLTDRIPTEPLIVLEVGQLTNEVSEYAITGVVSDKPYSLNTVKIYPHCDQPVKQATFKYDIYTQAVDLKVNPNTQPPTYWIDKTSLQQTLAEKDNLFSFEFLDRERFIFYFQFEAPETTLAEFTCKVFTVDNRDVPCQVREKGYLSLLRGIPWFGIGSILGIILIVLIEIVYAFKKRKSNVSHQKY
jgi:tetratricopeptide (TPR) repeat protein